MNFRLSSGSIKLVEVSLNYKTWVPLKKENPSQYTLVDQSRSKEVLSQPEFALRFTNYKGEQIVETRVPNLVGKNGFGNWYPTNINFKTT
jgi:hypothetical protein